jgi:plasmid stability protein
VLQVVQVSTTVQNLDEQAYRALLERAASEGRAVGDLLNEAVRSYLARPDRAHRRSTLRNLSPEPFPEGNERLSEEIDSIVYGDRRS